MQFIVEILLGLLLIFLIVGQPQKLRHYTRTTFGKILFLAATIGASFYSIYAGILIALIYMTLHKDFKLVETMTNGESPEDKALKVKAATQGNFVKKYCKDGKLDKSTNPPTLKYTNGKCNPCEANCQYEITSSQERMTVDEALRGKESNSIPV